MYVHVAPHCFHTHYSLLHVATVTLALFTKDMNNQKPLDVTCFRVYRVFLLALIAVYIVGLGLFEANAIQFGLDQLLEAPTPKLISFIHWYYWSQNVAGLILFYVTACGNATSHKNSPSSPGNYKYHNFGTR